MRSLIVPAAGNGTRLGLDGLPKALAPIGGHTLLGVILKKIGDLFDEIVVVIKPGKQEEFLEFLELSEGVPPLRFAFQAEAHGSLDAVKRGLAERVSGSESVVVWCDQVGVSRKTVSEVSDGLRDNGFVLPYILTSDPYVWLEIDAATQTIKGVGRRRDGDDPPDVGAADLGLFGLGADAADALVRGEFEVTRGSAREADFTYCIPALAAHYATLLLETHDQGQLVAVNTSEDLERARKSVFDEGGFS